MFFFAVLFIGLILLILWIILSLILTSNMVYYTKKKIPTLIAFPLSAFLILFIASFFTFGWGWFVPYALQPSYHEFKQMCELDPEIYQAKGGKLDKEYYNKLLKYYDLDWDTMIQTKEPMQLVEFIDKSRHTLDSEDIKQIDKITKPIPNNFSYTFDKIRKGRIEYSFDIYVYIKNGNVKPEKPAWFSVEWQTYRINDIIWDISRSGDFRMPTTILDCDYFKSKD